MNGQRRPQPTPNGERVVLIARRHATKSQTVSMSDALDWVMRSGFRLVSVVDPEDFRAAHRMIADDLADVIVIARPDHLPSVRVASEELMRRPEPLRPYAPPDPTPPRRTPPPEEPGEGGVVRRGRRRPTPTWERT